VKPGEITAPFHTAFGWHLARREPVVEIGAREILVTYAGAWRSAATRSKDEARARIQQALDELKGGADFAQVASKYSDDPNGKSGGDLGPVAKGQLIPAFEDAAFALQPGQRSDVVDTPYGFYVVERTR
jgi:parvulin-like peptidyl-prolyl isomerase